MFICMLPDTCTYHHDHAYNTMTLLWVSDAVYMWISKTDIINSDHIALIWTPTKTTCYHGYCTAEGNLHWSINIANKSIPKSRKTEREAHIVPKFQPDF